jgi:hypothetical protein
VLARTIDCFREGVILNFPQQPFPALSGSGSSSLRKTVADQELLPETAFDVLRMTLSRMLVQH